MTRCRAAIARRTRVFSSILPASNWPYAQAVHDYENVYLKTRERLLTLMDGQSPSEWRILDVGCGYAYPNVALFAGAGCAVSGVDTDTVFYRDGRFETFRSRLREKGILRALYWAGPRYGGYTRYYAVLGALARRTVDHPRLALRHYGGMRLPFPDGTFDAVLSNAVLEHVDNLHVLVAETSRVLRIGGVVDMLWHNFYSPSGGHRAADEVTRSPWGHVTGESVASCFLNRKRPEEIRAAFSEYLEVLRVVGVDGNHVLQDEPGYTPEGIDQLGQAPRDLLARYQNDLLTTRAFLIQAVKRAQQ